MSFREQVLEHFQGSTKILRSIAVMMEMDFHFAETGTTEIGQEIKVFGFVVLDRIKERVAWRLTVAIAEPAEETGIVMDPALDPCPRHAGGSVASLGFEVIGDGENEMNRTFDAPGFSKRLNHVRQEPTIETFSSEEPGDHTEPET